MLAEQFLNPQAILYRISLREILMLNAYHARKGVPVTPPSTTELIQHALDMENAPTYSLSASQPIINQDTSFIVQADDHTVFSKAYDSIEVLSNIVLTHYHGLLGMGLASAKIRPTVRNPKQLEELIQHQIKPLADRGIVLTEITRTPYKART